METKGYGKQPDGKGLQPELQSPHALGNREIALTFRVIEAVLLCIFK